MEGGRRSLRNTNGFLALGSSKEIHKTRPGRGNWIFEGPWYTRLLFQDRNSSERNDEWDFPCIGHNTYVCSRKKSWSKKTWTSASKEKPICAATVVRLFGEFILKVQLPQEHGQDQCHYGVCQHASLSVPGVSYTAYLLCGRTGIHQTC